MSRVELPFAEDIDGVWHVRRDDFWDNDAGAAVRAHAACGEDIWSGHVSAFPPIMGDEKARHCRGCFPAERKRQAADRQARSAAKVLQEVGHGLSESRADARRVAPGDGGHSRFVLRTSFGYPERYFDGDAQAFRYRIKRFETWLESDQKMGRWEWEPWAGQV